MRFRPARPIVQRPRTWPFQGQNTGSNPVGRHCQIPKTFNRTLTKVTRSWTKSPTTRSTTRIGHFLQADAEPCRILICDRDTKWSGRVRECVHDAGIRVVQTPYRAPNANSYAGRFVRSIKGSELHRVGVEPATRARGRGWTPTNTCTDSQKLNRPKIRTTRAGSTSVA
jgi:hypothetical protein